MPISTRLKPPRMNKMHALRGAAVTSLKFAYFYYFFVQKNPPGCVSLSSIYVSIEFLLIARSGASFDRIDAE